MNSETKIISIIGVITVAVIIFGMVMAGKASQQSAAPTAITAENLIRPETVRITGADPKLQIVEFGDFECPACAALQPELKKFLAEYGDQVDFAFRIIPIHANSKEAAAVAFAAGEQGKFKEMHDMLFEQQAEWTKYGISQPERIALYDKYAASIGLDVSKYKADFTANRSKYDAIVDQDAKDAQAMNIQSTPTLIIDGKTAIRGAQRYETLKAIFEEVTSQSGATTSEAADSSSLAL
ncbi:MAG TPA: thioredoxin domain-containing protein [Candidatus Paceibacterota bacterium]